MEHRTRVGNGLLAALPPADLDLLVPHFRMVPLERDAVLVRSGDEIQRIYFPLSGLIAFIMDMPNGQTVATAVVGNEGAAGMLTALGPAELSADGSGAGGRDRVANFAARFHAALGRSSALKGTVQTLTRALLVRYQNVAVQRDAFGRGTYGAMVAARPRSA